MSPIYTYPNSAGSLTPCACDEVDKYYFAIIDPVFYSFPDMSNWSIDGVDFIIGANGVMIGYGGSGQAYYNGSNVSINNQVGYLAFFGKFSNLPQPEVKDPLGNVISYSWTYLNGSICGANYPEDYLTCVEFELIKTNANIFYLDLYRFDPYLNNVNTGYPTNEGVSSPINIEWMNGIVPLDMNGAGADVALKAFLDPFFFNNVVVTVTATLTHVNIKISNIYAARSGYFDANSGKWKEMMLTLAC